MDQALAAHGPMESSEFMGAPRGKVGMWLFLASDAITFGALLAAYGAMRLGSPDWPVPGKVLDIPLTALNTFILICSSVTMVKALSAIRHGDVKGLLGYLGATMLGGATFLGIQAYEWTHLIMEGMTIQSNPWGVNTLFGATFYILTGFHGC